MYVAEISKDAGSGPDEGEGEVNVRNRMMYKDVIGLRVSGIFFFIVLQILLRFFFLAVTSDLHTVNHFMKSDMLANQLSIVNYTNKC